MKKVLALMLALVMALSMTAMAFAEETTVAAEDETEDAADDLQVYCGYCGSVFDTDDALANHQNNDCPNALPTDAAGFDYLALVKEILGAVVEIIKSENVQWDGIEELVAKALDIIEKGIEAFSEVEVKGIVEDLEALVGNIEIPGLTDLINTLKQAIKNLYANETVTDVPSVEETEPETTPDTGSGSSVAGIAVFATVSVAAAAAYVCTKKKA